MTDRQIGLQLGLLVLMIALLAIVYWQHTGERAVPALIEALESTDLQAQMLAAQSVNDMSLLETGIYDKMDPKPTPPQ